MPGICISFSIMWMMDASYTALQVSCAVAGEVFITVGQTEVICQSAGQQVG